MTGKGSIAVSLQDSRCPGKRAFAGGVLTFEPEIEKSALACLGKLEHDYRRLLPRGRLFACFFVPFIHGAPGMHFGPDALSTAS